MLEIFKIDILINTGLILFSSFWITYILSIVFASVNNKLLSSIFLLISIYVSSFFRLTLLIYALTVSCLLVLNFIQ